MARVRMYRGGEYSDTERELLSGQLCEILEDDQTTFLEVDGEPIKQPGGYMSVYELNRDRLTAVKAEYYIHEHEDEGTSYGELAIIDDLVSDAEVFEIFAAYTFTQDDFTG